MPHRVDDCLGRLLERELVRDEARERVAPAGDEATASAKSSALHVLTPSTSISLKARRPLSSGAAPSRSPTITTRPPARRARRPSARPRRHPLPRTPPRARRAGPLQRDRDRIHRPSRLRACRLRWCAGPARSRRDGSTSNTELRGRSRRRRCVADRAGTEDNRLLPRSTRPRATARTAIDIGLDDRRAHRILLTHRKRLLGGERSRS